MRFKNSVGLRSPTDPAKSEIISAKTSATSIRASRQAHSVIDCRRYGKILDVQVEKERHVHKSLKKRHVAPPGRQSSDNIIVWEDERKLEERQQTIHEHLALPPELPGEQLALVHNYNEDNYKKQMGYNLFSIPVSRHDLSRQLQLLLGLIVSRSPEEPTIRPIGFPYY